MQILYGFNIPTNLYDKIADFDAEIFPPHSSEFASDTAVPRSQILSMLKKNIQTTVIAIDDNNEIVGYYQAFPITQECEEKHLNNELSFKDIHQSNILPINSKNINLYIMSVGIKREYREKYIEDPNNPNIFVPLMLLLNEGLVDALTDLVCNGTKIRSIFGESVSKKGFRIMESLCGKNGLIYANNDDFVYSFYSKFNCDCDAFARCRNLNKLQQALNNKDNLEQ